MVIERAIIEKKELVTKTKHVIPFKEALEQLINVEIRLGGIMSKDSNCYGLFVETKVRGLTFRSIYYGSCREIYKLKKAVELYLALINNEDDIRVTVCGEKIRVRGIIKALSITKPELSTLAIFLGGKKYYRPLMSFKEHNTEAIIHELVHETEPIDTLIGLAELSEGSS